tara:strand:+ start:425 stop:805 length:381 start_codon:yes stop_codon:yes gene_type:complete
MSDDNVQNKVNDKFRHNVKKWISIDNDIRSIRSRTKELTKEKKEFEEYILNYLQEVGEKEFNIPDGKLRRNVYKSKAPLSKETIQKALAEIITDKSKCEDMTSHIINSRPLKERVSLKRTKNKGDN